jgi:hypothetical protein
MTDLNAKPSVAQWEVNDLNDLSPRVKKELVSNYLLANPSFLIDNPDLLVQIQVQMQHNGVVSLTQIQAAQSREKIQLLKSQLEALVHNARKNEVIYKTYADLNLALANTTSIVEVELCLHTHLVGTLRLESVRLVLLNNDNTQHAPLSEIQQRSLFDKKLARQPFYFGRVGNIEKGALFPKAEAESVALVLLNEHDTSTQNTLRSDKPANMGLLAIASKDPLHFQPEMDTVLLNYLRKNLNHHLIRLR